MRNKEHGREKGIDETSINVKNKQPKKSKVKLGKIQKTKKKHTENQKKIKQ